jgi:hypothetical protein
MLSIQSNKNKNCKSVGKITACKLFCKEYCFHISMGENNSLQSVLQSSLFYSAMRIAAIDSQILHMVIHVGKLRGTSCWKVSVFIDCSRVLPPPCLLEVWYRLFQTVFNVILVALCRLCYVQCRTQFFHVDMFLFPVSMSHAYFRFEVICKVTFWLKGHFLVILSEGASVWRKGCGLSPTVDMSGVWHGKENGCEE